MRALQDTACLLSWDDKSANMETTAIASILHVVVRERSMTHCGYCSDDECTPSVELRIVTMPVPQGLEVGLGDLLEVDVLQTLKVPYISFNHDGSGYCGSSGSPWKDVLDYHDSVLDIVCAMGADLELEV